MTRPLARPGDDELAQSLASLSLAAQENASATLKVYYHAGCLHHRFTRPDFNQQEGRQPEAHDASIVERPERLRAVLAGVHAAMARHPGRITLQTTEATLSLASSAVKTVHGPLQVTDESDYAQDLQKWLRQVDDRHAKGKCEIPSGYSQSDLYLAGGPTGSQMAIEGAMGASCLAVDEVCQASSGGVRFVACRPPGHHCGRDSPSGFCFVNNVAVTLQHAHDRHDIDRVLIFDIDLHHGNGTQSLVWDINSQAAVKAASMRTPASSPKGKHKAHQKRPLKVFYGSLHDILSFPCESGDPQLVANASVRLAAHDQHICNVHLKPYTSAAQFHTEVYPSYQKDLFGAATDFCKATQADPTKTLIIISAGMDACELEYTSMSRHNRRVPVSFYNRFARDVCSFASDPDSFAATSTSLRQSTPPKPAPRIVSILEGGYSDAALMSGTASLLQGLSAPDSEKWFTNQLEAKDIPLLDKACCINPPPPSMFKRLPPWAITAGEQLCLFLNESREEWGRAKERQAEMKARADQLADPSGPRALRERKEPKKYTEDSTQEFKPKTTTRQKTPQATPQKKPPRTRPWDDGAAVVVSEIPLHPSAPINEAIDFNQLGAAQKTVQPESKPVVEPASKLTLESPRPLQPTQVPLPASPATASTSQRKPVQETQDQPNKPAAGLQTVKVDQNAPYDTFSNPWGLRMKPPVTEQAPLAQLANSAQTTREGSPGLSRQQHHASRPSADQTKQMTDDLLMKSISSLQQTRQTQEVQRQGGQPAFPSAAPAPSGQAGVFGEHPQAQQPIEQAGAQRNQVKFTWQGAHLGGS